MKACVIHGAKDLRLSDRPEPVPGPGEVLIRLGAGGICGSDLQYFAEGGVGDFVVREPLILGHEGSGTIAALAGVEDDDAGLASGLLTTSQQVGGAIGVAILSTVAFTHATTLAKTGTDPSVALTSGFSWGFWVGVGIWAAALLSAIVLIREGEIVEHEPVGLPTAQS